MSVGCEEHIRIVGVGVCEMGVCGVWRIEACGAVVVSCLLRLP